MFYSVQDYEMDAINSFSNEKYIINYTSENLDYQNCFLSNDHQVVVIFSKDIVDKKIINMFNSYGVELICTRSTGYDNIDIQAAELVGITIANVPSYSPESIAEHSVMLMLGLCKKLKKAIQRTQEYNFKLNKLISKNLGELTIGVLGTGNIGMSAISILKGFGSKILAYDINPDYDQAQKLDFQYCSFSELIESSDIVSLYLPSTTQTKYILDDQTINRLKPGSFIVNVGRGKLIDTKAALAALKSGHLAGLGLDVYENEKEYFFADHSNNGINDEVLKKLIYHESVLLTCHQAFLTETSIKERISITQVNIDNYFNSIESDNFLTWHKSSEHESSLNLKQ